MVLGKGFRGRRIEWRYFRFNNIQDGGRRPSLNDGASPLRQLGFLVLTHTVHQNTEQRHLLQNCQIHHCAGKNIILT